MKSETTFFALSDDLILHILFNLEDDPRHWSRLACVCTKFSALISNICYKTKCSQTISSIVSDLLSSSSSSPDTCPPGGWSSLHKLSTCCPGLHHAGILLENSDFGLERELGSNEIFQERKSTPSPHFAPISSSTHQDPNLATQSWSLFDDLYYDTIYDVPESHNEQPLSPEELGGVVIKTGGEFSISNKKRKKCSSIKTHLASGVWNLSREQGNKLLGSRFRGDCLYICDWPGCLHNEEKRSYMLFRGIFKNFKKSQVWRTINDGNRSKIMLDCAFCSCKETWDLHSAFCLRRVFGFHDDGEPVVRAYVCENGHVSGAWTDRPMYS